MENTKFITPEDRQLLKECGALYAQLQYTEVEWQKDFAEKRAAQWSPKEIRDWLLLELLGAQMGLKSREVVN